MCKNVVAAYMVEVWPAVPLANPMESVSAEAALFIKYNSQITKPVAAFTALKNVAAVGYNVPLATAICS